MGKKKKVEEEEVYHVEVITRARVSDEGDWEYLVKWAGYGSDADSWEPQENVQQCDRLLASFWKHIGMDNNDYPFGYEAAAEQDWIDKEKRYFEETFVKPPKRKSDKATQKDRQEKQRSKLNTSHMSESSGDDSESSEEDPFTKMPVKRHSRSTRLVDAESDSELPSQKQISIVSRAKASTPPPKAAPKVPVQVKRQEMPSVAGDSLTIAPPKVTAVRTHQDQRANPLVKPLTLPSKSVEGGSSLSTKQRIAAGIPPPHMGPKPLPPAPKTSLPALSFKKNKLPVPASIQNKDITMSCISIATPASPVVPLTDVTGDANIVASPQPMEVDLPVDVFDTTLDDVGPLDGSSSGTFVIPIPRKSRDEINAENFLQSINIPVLSGPLEMTVTPDQPDQPAMELGKTPTISKIPKKWKWSGDLFISTSESKTELLCNVTIADPSGISNSSHINLLLSSLDSLRISKLYPIMDLSPLLRACGRSQYFGRLESGDEMAMCGLEHYLTSEGLAAIITLLLDGAEAAVLVIFPGAQQGLTKVLQVPEHLCSETPLVVVLLPFLMTPSAAGWCPVKTISQSPFDLYDVLEPQELSQQAMVYQAMSLLGFPKSLLDFLCNSTTSRSYSIWPSPGQFPLELDTAMLQCILKSTKAALVNLDEDVRVVFLSNRHLDTVPALPSLVSKRVNSPEVQFWAYGYSTNVSNEKWRVQEIYPLGGIVTFTPSALAEDLVGCHQLITHIIEHPLWDCYLIPEVLAVTHLLYNNGDQGSSSESCLCPILEWVNLGLISVMRMPEIGHSNQLPWLSQIFRGSSTSAQELLEICLEVLRSHPTTSSMTAEQLVAFTNSQVTKDLSRAQVQPALMESYRRFVVIRAASEDAIPFDKDGLEWPSLSLFSFKDDYFQQ